MVGNENNTRTISSTKDLLDLHAELVRMSEEQKQSAITTGIALNIKFLDNTSVLDSTSVEDVQKALLNINQLLKGNLIIANLDFVDLQMLPTSNLINNLIVVTISGRSLQPHYHYMNHYSGILKNALSILVQNTTVKEVNFNDFESFSKEELLELISEVIDSLKKMPNLEKLDFSKFNYFAGSQKPEVSDKFLKLIYTIVDSSSKLTALELPPALNPADPVIQAQIFKKLESNRYGTKILQEKYDQYIRTTDEATTAINHLQPLIVQYPSNQFFAEGLNRAEKQKKDAYHELNNLLVEATKKGEPAANYYLARLKESSDILGAYNLFKLIPESSEFYKDANYRRAGLLFTSEEVNLENENEEEKFEEIIRLLIMAGGSIDNGCLLSNVLNTYIHNDQGFAGESSMYLANILFDDDCKGGLSRAIGLLRVYKQAVAEATASKIRELSALEASARENIIANGVQERESIIFSSLKQCRNMLSLKTGLPKQAESIEQLQASSSPRASCS